jgi:hypothetical protein
MTAVLTASPVLPDEAGRTTTNIAFFSHKHRKAINQVEKDVQKGVKRGVRTEESLPLLRVAQDMPWFGWAVSQLGLVRFSQGNAVAALPLLEESRTLFKGQGMSGTKRSRSTCSSPVQSSMVTLPRLDMHAKRRSETLLV